MSEEAEKAVRTAKDGTITVYEFAAHRGFAIQQYQILEQSLCTLFAHLSGTAQSVAGTIFFKVTATRSRMAILSSLMTKRFDKQHRLFWSAYAKDVGQIDQRRNEIVHWGTGVVVKDGVADHMFLLPPNFWDSAGPDKARLYLADLQDFSSRCDVYARALNMFWLACCEMPNDPNYQSSRDIFQQPLEYPLPAGHPLARSSTEPLIPQSPFLVTAQ